MAIKFESYDISKITYSLVDTIDKTEYEKIKKRLSIIDHNVKNKMSKIRKKEFKA